jgi:hypothetical protein
MSTELFDLFGETGYCTICQDNLAEGERVRAVSVCQHLFHAKCLDAWFAQKGECPLCRIAVEVEIQVPVPVPPIQATRAEEIAAQIQRYSLTYALMDGILRKFPTAGEYRAAKQHIRTMVANLVLSNTRPFPTDYSFRAQVEKKKHECTVWLATQMLRSSHQIRSLPQVIAWRLRLAGRPALAPIWQAP